MKQSSNKKSREATAFLYERLSRDDNLEGESYSIGNQKKLLTKVAKEKGYTNLVHFLDDGISGVTMNRPGFVEMMQQLEQGKAAAVFVKDLSRLGRNYIEVGRLTEEFFPDHDIRLVAVSDNIDTAEGENELAPIRNLFNEMFSLRMEADVIQYSLQTCSKSVSLVLSVRPQSAVRLSQFYQSDGEAFPGQGFPDCGTAG